MQIPYVRYEPGVAPSVGGRWKVVGEATDLLWEVSRRWVELAGALVESPAVVGPLACSARQDQ